MRVAVYRRRSILAMQMVTAASGSIRDSVLGLIDDTTLRIYKLCIWKIVGTKALPFDCPLPKLYPSLLIVEDISRLSASAMEFIVLNISLVCNYPVGVPLDNCRLVVPVMAHSIEPISFVYNDLCLGIDMKLYVHLKYSGEMHEVLYILLHRISTKIGR